MVSLAYDSPASRADSTPGRTGMGTAALMAARHYKPRASPRLTNKPEVDDPGVVSWPGYFSTESTSKPMYAVARLSPSSRKLPCWPKSAASKVDGR